MPTLPQLSPFETFKRRWSNCTKCALSECRGRIALYRLKQVRAPILFVGEAPGESEDTLGKCFVGPAGTLLDGMIAAAGIKEEDCAFTNIICCIPRDEEGDKVTTPPLFAVEACRERLTEFVEMVQPRATVWVGEFAAKYGPGAINEKLAAKLGEVHRGLYTEYKITHPSALLRMNIAQKPLAIQRTIVTLKDVREESEIPF